MRSEKSGNPLLLQKGGKSAPPLQFKVGGSMAPVGGKAILLFKLKSFLSAQSFLPKGRAALLYPISALLQGTIRKALLPTMRGKGGPKRGWPPYKKEVPLPK